MVGAYPHGSRAEAWRALRGNKKAVTEWQQQNMDFGKRNEAPVRDAVCEALFPSCSVELTGLHVQRYRGHLVGASPDAFIMDGCLEIKCSAPLRTGERKEPVNAITYYDIPQILCQMQLTNRPVCYYARWNGSDTIAVFRAEHDKALFKEIMDECVDFYDTYVTPGVEPPNMKRGAKQQWMDKLITYGVEKTEHLENVPFSLSQ
jgi:hypothetical protein